MLKTDYERHIINLYVTKCIAFLPCMMVTTKNIGNAHSSRSGLGNVGILSAILVNVEGDI